MFKNLINEAVLTVQLKACGPLLIRSSEANSLDPALPDMSFVRAFHNGVKTVYLPGSSIKGVFRSRYEQVMRALGQRVCDTFDSPKNITCNKKLSGGGKVDGKERYKKCCEACKLFGCLSLGGRLSFADAYPVGEWKVGVRHGVGIDRITGASFHGALFDIETLESGVFAVECRMTNFHLYQLRTVIWILEDIHEGLVTFGMGGSRGNGQMRIENSDDVELLYRKYSDKAPSLEGEEIDVLFGKQVTKSGLPEILESLKINSKEELTNAIKMEAVI